jgi:hypothetical protein
MNKRYKDLTVKLSSKLQILTYDFMIENLEEEEKELTIEERQKLLKIANIMNGMDRKVFVKQLA